MDRSDPQGGSPRSADHPGHAPTDDGHHTVDVVVVGAGGAGMTAALAAAAKGLDTLVVEKSAYFGGSTARSGGGVWIPNNYALEAAGVPDSIDEAKTYLDSIVGDVVPEARRSAFLERGPETLEFVRDHSAADFMWVPGYSDYYPEAPGGRAVGRSVEPRPVNGKIIGDELARLHPPYAKAPAGMVVTQADYRWMSLAMRTVKGPVTTLRIVLGRMLNLLLRRPMYAMGAALVIGLRKGLLDAGVPVWYDSELTELLLESGRVTGLRLRRDGQPVTVHARHGVVLASGGFEKNLEMREKYQRSPITTDWTTGAESNTGGGITAGIAAGADVALMDDAWWGPTIPLTGGPYFCLSERNLPGAIIVNQAGRRYANEASPYVDAVHAMYAGEAETGVPHVPSWMILDQRYRNRYLFAGLGPRQPFPGRWYKHGTLFKSDTVEGLAEQIGVDPAGLAETVTRFNEMARTGVDTDFHRGDSAYDKYYGDPTNTPNPCLGPIDQAPFYAVKIVPGDLGTKGGIVTDERARALRPDGSVIDGLYAAGNASAAVMGHTYAGAGSTIGPAMVFGYLAALDIADRAAMTPSHTTVHATESAS
ncbi:MAG TPA: 3-oxosteroid 1-dehydrogenase [Nocardioidaceae bacterium]|nr:3-oxosteroid 1-dehydrogenase [Nocardioidaceae bacterium]